MPAPCIICGKDSTVDLWSRCSSCGSNPPTRNRWGERICKHGKTDLHYIEDLKHKGEFTVVCVGGAYLEKYYTEEKDFQPTPRIIETEIRGCG